MPNNAINSNEWGHAMIIQAPSSANSSASAISQSLTSRQTSSSPSANSADTVTISQAARQALSSSESSGPHTAAYPLEYYSVPKWQADLMPVVLSGRLGGVEGVYERGGSLVGGEYDSELAEYGKLFDSHLKAILQDKNIATTPEFHQAMIVDKESSENIRLLMKESIAGDNRMTELMKALGISLSD